MKVHIGIGEHAPGVPREGDKEAMPLGLQNTYYARPLYQAQKTQQLYLIHRNKHSKVAKMRRQRNMSQMKEQNKTPGKELNKMEISNLLDTEFKTLVIRMLNELRERVDELSETSIKR